MELKLVPKLPTVPYTVFSYHLGKPNQKEKAIPAGIMYSMIQLEWLFFRLVKYHFRADLLNPA